MNYSLNKRERLSNKQDIQTLFSKGKAFFISPLQILCMPVPQVSERFIKVGFAAPKKKYPTAVKRNKIKRLCREAYRLQKHELSVLIGAEQSWHIMIIYTGREVLNLTDIIKAMHKAFTKIKA